MQPITGSPGHFLPTRLGEMSKNKHILNMSASIPARGQPFAVALTLRIDK